MTTIKLKLNLFLKGPFTLVYIQHGKSIIMVKRMHLYINRFAILILFQDNITFSNSIFDAIQHATFLKLTQESHLSAIGETSGLIGNEIDRLWLHHHTGPQSGKRLIHPNVFAAEQLHTRIQCGILRFVFKVNVTKAAPVIVCFIKYIWLP